MKECFNKGAMNNIPDKERYIIQGVKGYKIMTSVSKKSDYDCC